MALRVRRPRALSFCSLTTVRRDRGLSSVPGQRTRTGQRICPESCHFRRAVRHSVCCRSRATAGGQESPRPSPLTRDEGEDVWLSWCQSSRPALCRLTFASASGWLTQSRTMRQAEAFLAAALAVGCARTTSAAPDGVAVSARTQQIAAVSPDARPIGAPDAAPPDGEPVFVRVEAFDC